MRHQFCAFTGLKPLGLAQAIKELGSLGHHSVGGTEAGKCFGNVHAAQLPGPVTEVSKQSLVDVLQGVEFVDQCRIFLRSSPRCLLVGFQDRFTCGQLALGVVRLYSVAF